MPLVGIEWGEVKTLVFGNVVLQPRCRPPWRLATARDELSYSLRLTAAAAVPRLATVQVHGRLDRARVVVPPRDGADWEQTFPDVHRPTRVTA